MDTNSLGGRSADLPGLGLSDSVSEQIAEYLAELLSVKRDALRVANASLPVGMRQFTAANFGISDLIVMIDRVCPGYLADGF